MSMKYKKVHDRGKCVKLSTFNWLGRNKVPSIENIMNKEKRIEEEEETANKDVEELFEALMYYELMELNIDA